MSPGQRLWNLLSQLLETARHGQAYVEGLSEEAFLADPKTQDAVILKILVIGELLSVMPARP